MRARALFGVCLLSHSLLNLPLPATVSSADFSAIYGEQTLSLPLSFSTHALRSTQEAAVDDVTSRIRRLTTERQTHFLFTGQKGNPGRALSLEDPLEYWLPTDLIQEVSAIPVQLHSIGDLLAYTATQSKNRHMVVLRHRLMQELAKRVIENRLIVGLHWNEAVFFYELLSAVEIARSSDGKITKVIFQSIPDFRKGLNPGDEKITYAIHRIGKDQHNAPIIEIVPTGKLFIDLFEAICADFKQQDSVSVHAIYPNDRRTDSNDIDLVLNSLSRSIAAFAAQNGKTEYEIYQQLAEHFDRLRIEIRLEADHPEVDLPAGPNGTAVIILPKRFIPASELDTAARRLLDFITLSELLHLLHPERPDLDAELKGIEPLSLWLFINHHGIQATLEALNLDVARGGEFARRVTVTLTAALTEHSHLAEARPRDQAAFIYHPDSLYFASIWGHGLLDALAHESTRMVYGPNGRVPRTTSLITNHASGNVPWKLLFKENREFLRQLVIRLASLVAHVPVEQVGRAELLRLDVPDYLTVMIPEFGQTLAQLHRLFERKIPGRNLSTRRFILKQLFPEMAFSFPTVSNAYTLETLRIMRDNGDLEPARLHKFWEQLPPSAIRALLHEQVPDLDDQPFKSEDYSRANPTLGHSLKGYSDYLDRQRRGTAGSINGLEAAGFASSPDAAAACLLHIVEGLQAFRRDASLPRYDSQRPYFTALIDPQNLEALPDTLLEAIRNADSALKNNPDDASLQVWKNTLEAYWGLIDTARWMPNTLAWALQKIPADEKILDTFFALLRPQAVPKMRKFLTRGVVTAPETAAPLTPGEARQLARTTLDSSVQEKLLQVLSQLAAQDPLTYHSPEALQKIAGTEVPALTFTRILKQLAAEGKVIRQPGAQPQPIAFRLPFKTHEPRPADPRAIFWHGMTRATIEKNPAFRRDGDLTLLESLAGPHWNLLLTDTGRNQELVYQEVVRYTLDLYERLGTYTEPVSAQRLGADHSLTAPPNIFINDAETVDRAFQWLERKGFALRRESTGWMISGIARDQFLDLDPMGWPEPVQHQLRALDNPLQISGFAEDLVRSLEQDQSSTEQMQRRLELFLSMNGLPCSAPYIKELTGIMRGTLASHNADGIKLDAALQETGRAFGFESSKIRLGQSRYALMRRFVRTVLDMPALSPRQRLFIFRRLAGLSRKELAAASGIREETLHAFEVGDISDFKDPAVWSRIAAALDVDIFILMTGKIRAEALRKDAGRDFIERVDLLRKIVGLYWNTLEAIPQWEMHLGLITRGFAPALEFQEALSLAFPDFGLEELFGSLLDAPPYGGIDRTPGKKGSDPQEVLQNIRHYVETHQKPATFADYMAFMGRESAISGSTLRRIILRLVEEGHLREIRNHGHVVAYQPVRAAA